MCQNTDNTGIPCFFGVVHTTVHLPVPWYSDDSFLYPQHTKYVGVYSFCFSVRLFIRTYVCSFVGSSFHHKVKVFALKFIRPFDGFHSYLA